jgi:hypothetical protein
MGEIFAHVGIQRELVTVHGGNVMAVQIGRKWCRDFQSLTVVE